MGQKQDFDKRHLEPETIRQILRYHRMSHGRQTIANVLGISVNSVRTVISRFEVLYGEALQSCGAPDSDSPDAKKKTVSPGEYAESIVKQSDELIDAMFHPKAPLQTVRADTVIDGRYYPDFRALAAIAVIEKRQSVSQVYRSYLDVCREKQADPLSQSYFYESVKKEVDSINRKNDDYYFIQDFRYGEYVELDFSGDRYRVQTNNMTEDCWIMVFTFPASYYTFATFVSAQSTAESCRGIAEFVKYLDNRMPLILKCDNFKAAITSHRGSSIVPNASFQNFMRELGLAIEAAPVRKPQRKSSVEAAVGLIQTRCGKDPDFLKELQTLKTFADHCSFLQKQVDLRINQAPFRKDTQMTRENLFNAYERPRLMPVFKIPDYAEILKEVKVSPNYHVPVNGHLYSVPFTCIGSCVEPRLTPDAVIFYLAGTEVARHDRKDGKPGDSISLSRSTKPEHCPPEHQAIMKDSERFCSEEAVLKIARELDKDPDGLYAFCKRKFECQKNDPSMTVRNAITSCAAVIRLYEGSADRSLVSRACRITLSQSQPRLWNKVTVEQHLRELRSQKSDGGSVTGGLSVNYPSGEDAFFNTGKQA